MFLKFGQKYFIPFFIVVSLAACGGGGGGGGSAGYSSDNEEDENGQLTSNTTNSIVGTWEKSFHNSDCIETIIFYDINTFDLTSSQELMNGNYSFESSVTTGTRHELIVETLSDNGLTDCAGSSIDQTGDTDQVYLEFLTESNFVIYLTSEGGEIVADFELLIPTEEADGVVEDEDGNEDGDEEDDESTALETTNSILGYWVLPYAGSNCTETMILTDDNKFLILSLDEIVTGNYSFESTVITGTRHKLTLEVIYDNGLADCNGNSDYKTGFTFDAYVEFSTSDIFYIYTEKEDGEFIAKFSSVPSPSEAATGSSGTSNSSDI